MGIDKCSSQILNNVHYSTSNYQSHSLNMPIQQDHLRRRICCIPLVTFKFKDSLVNTTPVPGPDKALRKRENNKLHIITLPLSKQVATQTLSFGQFDNCRFRLHLVCLPSASLFRMFRCGHGMALWASFYYET